MPGRHVCQLRGDEKACLVNDLKDLICKLQTKQSPYKYLCADDPPEFLKRKIPRYVPNYDLIPLITHTSTVELKPTSNPKMLFSEGEDPNTIYLNVGGTQGNPYKTEFETVDPLCRDICRQQNFERQMLLRTAPQMVTDPNLCRCGVPSWCYGGVPSANVCIGDVGPFGATNGTCPPGYLAVPR